jgi:phage terminase large subunit-like protein
MSTAAPPPEFLAAADLFAARTPDSQWRREARPGQLQPDGDWFVWLIVAGRGWGKTRTGAQWLAEQALAQAGDYLVVGRSEQDTREVCVEGRSGLLQALGLQIGSPAYARGTGQIRLENGSVIYSMSAESPERARGPNLSGAWCDELAAWRFTDALWHETLMPALRIGDPRVVVTTTPRPVPLLRELLSRDDGSVVVTRGSTFENAANLSRNALDELKRRYEGTRIGRQELLAELLEDIEGALWSRELIDPYRVETIDRKELVRIVVAVDPAMGAGKGDETGIIVAGIDGDGHGFVLDDVTCRLPPDGWARAVAGAYERWHADRIVAEVNQGGRLVETVLRTVDPGLPITLVHASHGKATRAEPIAAVYEQGRVHHVGAFAQLEDQLCTWVPGRASSPDRLDALVWALTELKPGARATLRGEFFTATPQPSRWGLLRPGQAFGRV